MERWGNEKGDRSRGRGKGKEEGRERERELSGVYSYKPTLITSKDHHIGVRASTYEWGGGGNIQCITAYKWEAHSLSY